MILAVDPGRDKTGVALVSADGLVAMAIVETKALEAQIEAFLGDYTIEAMVCGDGTFHKIVAERLESLSTKYGVTLSFIDEYNTTVEGRARYWEHTPRTGWKKFFPASWFMPPVPVDDYTAWIIGERFLRKKDKVTYESRKGR